MNAFWFGLGGVVIFVSLMVLLPLLLSWEKKIAAIAIPAAEGMGDKSKKTLGKVVKLVLAALVVAFILYYDWLGTAVGKRLADFLGTEYADLFNTLVMVPMFLVIALLLFKSLSDTKSSDGKSGAWFGGLMTILTICLVAGIFGYSGYKATEIHAKISNDNPYVPFNLRHARLQTPTQEGVAVEQEMAVDDVARAEMRTPLYPFVVYACPKIIKPEGLNHDNINFVLIAGKGTSANSMVLDESSQKKMRALTRTMTVAMTAVLWPANDPESPCAYLKR